MNTGKQLYSRQFDNRTNLVFTDAKDWQPVYLLVIRELRSQKQVLKQTEL